MVYTHTISLNIFLIEQSRFLHRLTQSRECERERGTTRARLYCLPMHLTS